MRRLGRWAGVVGVVGAVLVGCLAKVAPVAEGDAGALDGGDDAGAQCELQDGTCVGRYCCYNNGRAVDFERGCLGPREVLSCVTVREGGFFSDGPGNCGGSTAESCLMRDRPGDAGREVYWTPYIYEIPGFDPCPSDLRQEVFDMPNCGR
jgi:hypothetical protein